MISRAWGARDSAFPRKGLVSGYLDEITTMSKDTYRNGRGAITFGNGSTCQTPMGDDFGFGHLTLAFVNVKDVEKITHSSIPPSGPFGASDRSLINELERSLSRESSIR
jgi:hypothetical protein